MDCNKCNELISEYIDESITQEDKVDFEKHIKFCRQCASNYQLTKQVVDTLNELEEVEPPHDLSANIITQIEKGKGHKKMSFRRVLSYVAVLICGVMITTLTLQGAFFQKDSTGEIALMQDGASTNNAISGSGVEIAQDGVNIDSKVNGETTYSAVFDKEKIIYQGNINLDVKDSEEASGEIVSYIEENGGFIESSNTAKIQHNQNETNLNQTYIVIRVPSARFKETMEKLKEYGEVTSSNINSTNVSTQYRDIQSEKDSLEIQQERLLSYLKESEKVEDMIAIETELNRVRTELNTINTQLTNYDQLISYSNITVNLQESKTLTTTIKSPFGQLLENISKGFISSINLLLQSISFLVVFVFRLIPFLIVIVPLGFIIKKKLIKKKNLKK